jgi:hypothetical protein
MLTIDFRFVPRLLVWLIAGGAGSQVGYWHCQGVRVWQIERSGRDFLTSIQINTINILSAHSTPFLDWLICASARNIASRNVFSQVYVRMQKHAWQK